MAGRTHKGKVPAAFLAQQKKKGSGKKKPVPAFLKKKGIKKKS